MIARKKRHFIAPMVGTNRLRGNSLAIAAVTVTVAAERIIGKSRRRFMSVGCGCNH